MLKNSTFTVSKFGWFVCIASQSDWRIISSVQKITYNSEDEKNEPDK